MGRRSNGRYIESVADKEKIEGFLLQLSLTHEEVSDDIWVINDEESSLENVVVVLADPVLIVRVKVMVAPSNRREEFFEQLLLLNGSDLVHGAYALDGDDVLLINTLVSETLDLEEFRATLDAVGLALAQHYQALSDFR